MIQRETKFILAICDGCKRSLIDAHKPHNANYGRLQTSFNYGSRLDDIGNPEEYHLCEDCWEKALAAVGIKIGD